MKHFVIAFLLAATLAACAGEKTLGPPPKPQTFEQVTLRATNDALDGWYLTQGLIGTYLSWEVCKPAGPPLCKKPKQAAKLQALDKLVSGELKRLRPLFEQQPSNMEVALAITNAVTSGYIAYYRIKQENE